MDTIENILSEYMPKEEIYKSKLKEVIFYDKDKTYNFKEIVTKIIEYELILQNMRYRPKNSNTVSYCPFDSLEFLYELCIWKKSINDSGEINKIEETLKTKFKNSIENENTNYNSVLKNSKPTKMVSNVIKEKYNKYIEKFNLLLKNLDVSEYSNYLKKKRVYRFSAKTSIFITELFIIYYDELNLFIKKETNKYNEKFIVYLTENIFQMFKEANTPLIYLSIIEQIFKEKFMFFISRKTYDEELAPINGLIDHLTKENLFLLNSDRYFCLKTISAEIKNYTIKWFNILNYIKLQRIVEQNDQSKKALYKLFKPEVIAKSVYSLYYEALNEMEKPPETLAKKLQKVTNENEKNFYLFDLKYYENNPSSEKEEEIENDKNDENNE